CLQEPDVAMMARCIRLDIDCAEICRLALSWGVEASSRARFARRARRCATRAPTSAKSTSRITAGAARKLAAAVQMNAAPWRPHVRAPGPRVLQCRPAKFTQAAHTRTCSADLGRLGIGRLLSVDGYPSTLDPHYGRYGRR